MVNEVMGYKSPLYGRMTASMEVLPFDYLDAAQFFPNFSIEQQLLAFGILGGIPRYLNAFSDEKSIKENIQDEIMTDLSTYMGQAFEDICVQFLKRKAKAKELPFVPAEMGKWWGNNPAIRAQDDVDILAYNRKRTEALFCECKFTNRPMPMEEYEDLVIATKAFPEAIRKHLIFISKSGYAESVQRRAAEEGAVLYTIDDLFRI